MKTLKQLTEGLFDVEDNITNVENNEKLKDLLSWLSISDAETTLDGNDLTIKILGRQKTNWDKGRSAADILGYPLENVTIDFSNIPDSVSAKLWMPGITLTNKNFCKNLTIIPGRYKSLHLDIAAIEGINMDLSDMETVVFTGSVRKCDIKSSTYLNIHLNQKDSKCDNTFNNTIVSAKGFVGILVATTLSSRCKTFYGKVFGDKIYWSQKTYATLGPPKLSDWIGSSNPCPFKDVPTPALKTPTWIGAIVDDGFPRMSLDDLNDVFDNMGIKFIGDFIDQAQFQWKTNYLEFNKPHSGDVYNCKYGKVRT